MFDAQLLIAKTGAYSVYSPWFPRGGDNVVFAVEVIDRTGTGAFLVDLVTKKSDEANDGTPVSGAQISVTTESVPKSDTKEGGLEDLVRYKFTLWAGAGEWILFRMLAPQWYDTV